MLITSRQAQQKRGGEIIDSICQHVTPRNGTAHYFSQNSLYTTIYTFGSSTVRK